MKDGRVSVSGELGYSGSIPACLAHHLFLVQLSHRDGAVQWNELLPCSKFFYADLITYWPKYKSDELSSSW